MRTSRFRSPCRVYWGSHACAKRYPHRNHRCRCGHVVDRSGAEVKTIERPPFRWDLYGEDVAEPAAG